MASQPIYCQRNCIGGVAFTSQNTATRLTRMHSPRSTVFVISTLLASAAVAQEQNQAASYDPAKVSWFAGSIVPKDVKYKTLTGEQRLKLYLRQAYLGPGAYFRAFGSSIGDQMNTRPEEWGDGGSGYARRVGNRFARFTIQDSIEAAGAAAMGHEVRYIRCRCDGFFPRFGHVIAMSFATYNRNGKWVPHVSRIGATFAAEYIGKSWMPPSAKATSGDVARGVALQFGFGTLFNTFREFGPDIKRGFRGN